MASQTSSQTGKTGQFDESAHPRSGDGTFTTKQRAEADQVHLITDADPANTNLQPSIFYMHEHFQVTSDDPRNTDDCEVVVPAGEYVLGDPCYVVPDEQWMPLLESCGYFGGDSQDPDGQSPVGYIEFTPDPIVDANGQPVPGALQATLRCEVLSFGTAYGDGRYNGSDGNEYAVDAGMIGLVPLAACDPAEVERATGGDRPLSRRITFDGPATCRRDPDGTLTFGPVTIKTGDEEEEDRYCDHCGVRPTEGWSDLCYECQSETCDECGYELESDGSCSECEDIGNDEDEN